MRPLTIIIAFFYTQFAIGQNTISEIKDLKIRERVVQVKSQTDSFLVTKVGIKAYRKMTSDYGVTFIDGEFFMNYLFLNKYYSITPTDINNLVQYYLLNDTSINLRDTIGVYYYDDVEKEIRFSTIINFLKAKAIKEIYEKNLSNKINNIIHTENLKKPFLKIAVDQNSLSYLILLKDQDMSHNYWIH